MRDSPVDESLANGRYGWPFGHGGKRPVSPQSSPIKGGVSVPCHSPPNAPAPPGTKTGMKTPCPEADFTPHGEGGGMRDYLGDA